jgi:hypothetical protein
VLPTTATESSWVIKLANIARGSIRQSGAATNMKRPVQPRELWLGCLLLASPVCASYITGIVLLAIGSVGA